MPDAIIQSDTKLNEYIQRHCDCKIIGFDTEFVSEDTYRPELCLIQVNADRDIALIDPYNIDDPTPFWQWLTDPSRTILVHACREELRFIC